MEEQKLLRCAFGWDDVDMVSVRGRGVQFHDPPMSSLHHSNAGDLHMAKSRRDVQLVLLLTSLAIIP